MNVLLVHGLGRTPVSLFGLAASLRHAGHRTGFFAYSPTLESVPRIVRRLRARLGRLAGAGKPVGLVGHSLGGLLLRLAVSQLPDLRVRRLVMLGSPNRPPRLARFFSKAAPFHWLTRDCGGLLASPDTILRLPTPAVPCLLIAGTAGPRGPFSPFGMSPNDGVVALDETPIDGLDPPMSFPVWHTLIMNDAKVRQAVISAFSGNSGD